jgi:tRNA threonylcarbamoyladenosine biosynthesis protein TsaB
LVAAQVVALPTAAALLRLAPSAWAAGQAVPPEEALPLYIRDKVAQTTEERSQLKAQQVEKTP